MVAFAVLEFRRRRRLRQSQRAVAGDGETGLDEEGFLGGFFTTRVAAGLNRHEPLRQQERTSSAPASSGA